MEVDNNYYEKVDLTESGRNNDSFGDGEDDVSSSFSCSFFIPNSQYFNIKCRGLIDSPVTSSKQKQ